MLVDKFKNIPGHLPFLLVNFQCNGCTLMAWGIQLYFVQEMKMYKWPIGGLGERAMFTCDKG